MLGKGAFYELSLYILIDFCRNGEFDIWRDVWLWNDNIKYIHTFFTEGKICFERVLKVDYSYDREVVLKIRKYRKENKMTQDQLAARLQVAGYDLTRVAVAKIESGQRHIYLYELNAIREILHVSFDDLLKN